MTFQPSKKERKKVNPAIEWASIIVNELAKCGLTAVCIAPGSRSTPLALAFHAHPHIHEYVHLDERSAAFFALGMAMAQQKSVAVLSTSGTAGANFLPAIIEAKMSNIPLLIMTADRPSELRNSGANQTIDQVKMFGDHVLWSVDVGIPEDNPPKRVYQNLRTLAARALFTAEGIVQGPVHLNFPFRKPLEPADELVWQEALKTFEIAQPHTKMDLGVIQPAPAQINYLSQVLEDHPRGIIVCGPGCEGPDFAKAVAHLSKKSGYPILADPLSGVRFGPHTRQSTVISGYETFLNSNILEFPLPDVVLRFGRVPTSKWLHEYLRVSDRAQHIHVRENGVWADGDHVTSYFLQASPTSLLNSLGAKLLRPNDAEWNNIWTAHDTRVKAFMDTQINDYFFDGAIVHNALEQAPDGTTFFVGNSLPIRHLDQFCPSSEKKLNLFSNRGASGIDGNISTALGLAAQTNEPVVLLLGDITFYHDSNGLLAIKKFGLKNITIVLLNNNGGGIFRRLPVANFKDEYRDLFDTPHNLNFEGYAQLYEIDYTNPGNLPSFNNALASALASDRATLIELQTNSEKDEFIRKQIITTINSRRS